VAPGHPTIFGLFSVCKTCESPEADAFTRCLHPENRPLIANWDDSGVKVGSKTLVFATLASALLAFAAPALADRDKPSEKSGPPPTTTVSHSATISVQGVVQSVSGSAVVVRQLDGSAVSVGISRNTRITVDGRPGKISDVKPGFVLVTSVKVGQPASALRFLRPG
jgi:hypothetical protein